jgi:hypothetical protein
MCICRQDVEAETVANMVGHTQPISRFLLRTGIPLVGVVVVYLLVELELEECAYIRRLLSPLGPGGCP